MSIKRTRQVSRGPRGREEDAGSSASTAKPAARGRTWADEVAGQPDESFVPYAMTGTFAKGTFVLHSKFGKGLVTEAEGLNIDVLFEEGPKRLRHNPAAGR